MGSRHRPWMWMCACMWCVWMAGGCEVDDEAAGTGCRILIVHGVRCGPVLHRVRCGVLVHAPKCRMDLTARPESPVAQPKKEAMV